MSTGADRARHDEPLVREHAACALARLAARVDR
jgi:hypothetical protein